MNILFFNLKLCLKTRHPAGAKIVIFIKTTFMEKSKKGLADAQEGEFILNESGTAVSADPVEGVDIPAANDLPGENKKDDEQRDGDAEQEKKQ